MKTFYPLFVVLFLISIGNGQKLHEVIETYKNGNIKSIHYHEKTGNRMFLVKIEMYHNFPTFQVLDYETVFKNGKRGDKVITKWHLNGQKEYEETYKDHKQDGLYTSWYDNGQKKYEMIYKNGKINKVIGKWNEDGSVKE